MWWHDIDRQIIYENDIYKYSVDITMDCILIGWQSLCGSLPFDLHILLRCTYNCLMTDPLVCNQFLKPMTLHSHSDFDMVSCSNMVIRAMTVVVTSNQGYDSCSNMVIRTMTVVVTW